MRVEFAIEYAKSEQSVPSLVAEAAVAAANYNHAPASIEDEHAMLLPVLEAAAEVFEQAASAVVEAGCTAVIHKVVCMDVEDDCTVLVGMWNRQVMPLSETVSDRGEGRQAVTCVTPQPVGTQAVAEPVDIPAYHTVRPMPEPVGCMERPEIEAMPCMEQEPVGMQVVAKPVVAASVVVEPVDIVDNHAVR